MFNFLVKNFKLENNVILTILLSQCRNIFLKTHFSMIFVLDQDFQRKFGSEQPCCGTGAP